MKNETAANVAIENIVMIAQLAIQQIRSIYQDSIKDNSEPETEEQEPDKKPS